MGLISRVSSRTYREMTKSHSEISIHPDLHRSTPVIYTVNGHLVYDPDPLKQRTKNILKRQLQNLYDDFALNKIDRAVEMHKICNDLLRLCTELLERLEEDLHHNNASRNNMDDDIASIV